MGNYENNPNNARIHPEFEASYTHTDRETGETFEAPFPAAVFGIHREFFGVGQVVGSIDGNPVLEIEDRDDGLPYHVMGYESWWTSPVPQEVIDMMASGELSIDSVAAYRAKQDKHWKRVEDADREFLEDTDIDPDSA